MTGESRSDGNYKSLTFHHLVSTIVSTWLVQMFVSD